MPLYIDIDGPGLESSPGTWRDNVRLLIVYIYTILDSVSWKIHTLAPLRTGLLEEIRFNV